MASNYPGHTVVVEGTLCVRVGLMQTARPRLLPHVEFAPFDNRVMHDRRHPGLIGGPSEPMVRVADWLPGLTPRRRRQLWYGPLLALAMALALSRLLWYARAMDVAAFGLVSAGLLVSSSFCMFGCFGLMPMLQREWPVWLVHRQHWRGLVRAAQCFVVAAGAGVLLLAGAAAGLGAAGLAGAALAAALVHGIAQQLFLVVTTGSRSAGDTLRYARQQLLRSVAMLAAGTALVDHGPVVVLAAEATVTLAMVAAVGHSLDSARPVRWRVVAAAAWRRLPRVPWTNAMTLMGVMLLSFAMVNVDRWFASALLDVAAFGRYSFAAIVLAVAQAAQALINAAGYPLIARRQAAEGGAGAFRAAMKLSALVFIAGLAMLVPAAWFGRFAVERWYPDYAAIAPLLPWLALIGLARAADFWSSFLIIGGHESTVLRLNLGAAVVALLAWSSGVALSMDALAQPAAFAVLAGLVTAAGTTATLVYALRIGGRCSTPPAAGGDVRGEPQRGGDLSG